MLKKSIFLKINTITLGSVIVLILVGSVVRSLGAGMGCPDWPKCFGSYVPPTSHEELPSNYLEIFRDQRIEKNQRLASTLLALGYQQLAEKITNDPDVLSEEEFSVSKAWIEYINRLVGVLIGLFVFANLVFSFSFRKEDRWIPVAGVAVFVLTGFQGWLGSLVVSTNLLHGFITIHMVVALIILALLIWINARAKKFSTTSDRLLSLLSVGLLILFIPQLILGTEVRSIVDDLISSETLRGSWADFLNTNAFYIHRSYSWILFFGVLGLYYLVNRRKYDQVKKASKLLLILVVGAMMAGLGMVRFGFPFWLQPLHLVIATGIFSILFYLTLRFKIS